MITLYDSDTDERLGDISPAQLQLMTDSMEEESTTDQDYYIDANTLDYLTGRGVDAGLIALLRAALADRKGMTVRWEG